MRCADTQVKGSDFLSCRRAVGLVRIHEISTHKPSNPDRGFICYPESYYCHTPAVNSRPLYSLTPIRMCLIYHKFGYNWRKWTFQHQKWMFPFHLTGFLLRNRRVKLEGTYKDWLVHLCDHFMDIHKFKPQLQQPGHVQLLEHSPGCQACSPPTRAMLLFSLQISVTRVPHTSQRLGRKQFKI